MPQTYLVFDFGANEDAVQLARHKLEAWKQAFRLGEKLLFKFERKAAQEKAPPVAAAKQTRGKTKPKQEEKTEQEASVQLLVRLDFSEHERLSYQRWLQRIPREEPFAALAPAIVSRNDVQFARTRDLFDALD
jgi:hypothetical protein